MDEQAPDLLLSGYNLIICDPMHPSYLNVEFTDLSELPSVLCVACI